MKEVGLILQAQFTEDQSVKCFMKLVIIVWSSESSYQKEKTCSYKDESGGFMNRSGHNVKGKDSKIINGIRIIPDPEN